MKTDLPPNAEAKLKYDLYNRQLMVMGDVVTLLACASIYSQKGYNDFHIMLVFGVSFVITAGYLIYRIRDRSFASYCKQWYGDYLKTTFSRVMSILCLVAVVLRFFLPDKIVFYLQNAFYVSAIVFFIVGIIFMVFQGKKCRLS